MQLEFPTLLQFPHMKMYLDMRRAIVIDDCNQIDGELVK